MTTHTTRKVRVFVELATSRLRRALHPEM